ncbi:MAG: RidA family protein [Magnetococcales bacterium]|nr:RidA family protein [Magnetococcales bacterium]
MSKKKLKSIKSERAPAVIGPYSQAVRVGELLFVSGQIPVDPATGELVEGDAAAQAQQVLRNLESVVTAAGGSLSQVMRSGMFLVDLADFQAVNQVYSSYFHPPYPARSTVQVAALPKGARVEIEAVVHLKSKPKI